MVVRTALRYGEADFTTGAGRRTPCTARLLLCAGERGAQAAAAELGVPFLGEIPLNISIRLHGDAGDPEKIFTQSQDYVREAIDRVVANTAGQVSVRGRLQLASPTLTVE